MPRYIFKLNGMYGEWSTVVDAPVTLGMTLSEFKTYYEGEYGSWGMKGLDDRLERVERIGHSSFVYENVDQLIEYNRAGRNEECLTKEQLIYSYQFDVGEFKHE